MSQTEYTKTTTIDDAAARSIPNVTDCSTHIDRIRSQRIILHASIVSTVRSIVGDSDGSNRFTFVHTVGNPTTVCDSLTHHVPRSVLRSVTATVTEHQTQRNTNLHAVLRPHRRPHRIYGSVRSSYHCPSLTYGHAFDYAGSSQIFVTIRPSVFRSDNDDDDALPNPLFDSH